MAQKSPEQINLKRQYDLGLKIFDLANLWAIAFFFRDIILPDFKQKLLIFSVGTIMFIILYVLAWRLTKGGDGS